MTRDELLTAYANGKRNFRVADLRDANLSDANLSDANLPHYTICPEVGSFTAYKKLAGGRVCELLIPADAPRTSSLVGRKCRAMYATVIGIRADGVDIASAVGLRDTSLVYAVGETVVADDWDDDIRVECTHGIHFFITRREAEEYNG